MTLQGFLSGVLNNDHRFQRADSTELADNNSGPGLPPSWLSGPA